MFLLRMIGSSRGLLLAVKIKVSFNIVEFLLLSIRWKSKFSHYVRSLKLVF